MLPNNSMAVAALACLLMMGCSIVAKRSVRSESRYAQAQRELVNTTPHLSSEDHDESYAELCGSKDKSALASKDWAGALNYFDCAIKRNPQNQLIREDACTASSDLAQRSRDGLAPWEGVVQRCSELPEGAGKVDTALREQARELPGDTEATTAVCHDSACVGVENHAAREDSIEPYEANPEANDVQAVQWQEEIGKQKQADQEDQQREANLGPAEKALAACYLMVPPFPRLGWNLRDARADGVVPDSDAPLSKWYWAGSFDSLDACWRDQEKEIVKAQNRERAQPAAKRDRSVQKSFREARCIAIDDPRLKEK